MNAVSVSQCLNVLNALCQVLNVVVSDDVFKRKKCLFNGEIMFYSGFQKDTEKVVLLN